jgi:penicillin-binding protein 1A
MPYEGKHDHEEPWRNLEEEPLPRRPRLSWRLRLLLGFVALTTLVLVGGLSAFQYLSRDLPPVEAVLEYQPSLVTRVYAHDGRQAGQYYVERRVLVPLKEVPKSLVHAIIAVEDSRFYEHKGVDPLGILRAVLANLESFTIRQGASTITQQLARSLFLTPERSLQRKIKEAILAWKMEKVLTKDQILDLYLNQIYFGHGAYGIQAASKTYFGKAVQDLTLSEVALLSGLPRAPRDYSPYLNPERAKQRQGVVLRRMVEEGFITDEDFNQAYQQDLFFKPLERAEEAAPYFLEHVRQYLVTKYGETAVYKGGLSVHTTLDLDLQRAAVQAVEEGLREVDKRQGYRGPLEHKTPEETAKMLEEDVGLLSLSDVREGDVVRGIVTAVDEKGAQVVAAGLRGRIAMEGMAWARKRLKGKDLLKDVELLESPRPADLLKAGDVIEVGIQKADLEKRTAVFRLEQDPVVEGALLSLDPKTGAVRAMVGGYDFKRSEFNRSVLARRQPGSAFKPFIYATAIERGLTPATVLMDSPVIFEDSVLQKVWKPENYEGKFNGPVTLRDALTFSRNVATVRLLDRIGVKPVAEMAQRVGITSPLSNDLTLALGSSGITLMEAVSGFGVFANRGVRAEPIAILKVEDPNGKVLEENRPQSQRVMAEETAYLMTNMMQDVIQRGTGWRARVLGKPLAGKTGTTNDFTDAWFVGYAPNLATGVWVGFDDQRSLGDRQAGGTAALPIWVEYMRVALSLIPEEPFPIPDSIVFVKVDPETGLLPPPTEPEAPVEVFIQGTEPSRMAEKEPSVVDFYRLDMQPAVSSQEQR